MIGRAGVLPLAGAVIVLAASCSHQPGTAPGAPAAAQESSSASAGPAREVTNKDMCGLVNAETLSGMAFPVTAGTP
ncbi:MAG TPA: hypothetical protein VFO16_07205, partial [Pseudonocardiaceae bacterium]|nr:hypothetical protein [Pseudonocardiaceae bacterium]